MHDDEEGEFRQTPPTPYRPILLDFRRSNLLLNTRPARQAKQPAHSQHL